MDNPPGEAAQLKLLRYRNYHRLPALRAQFFNILPEFYRFRVRCIEEVNLLQNDCIGREYYKLPKETAAAHLSQKCANPIA